MAYEVIILGHLHMPLYFLGTFTEYPQLIPDIPCLYSTITRYPLVCPPNSGA